MCELNKYVGQSVVMTLLRPEIGEVELVRGVVVCDDDAFYLLHNDVNWNGTAPLDGGLILRYGFKYSWLLLFKDYRHYKGYVDIYTTMKPYTKILKHKMI